MLNCNIPNALYFALLLGSACYAAPLSSTPTPQALAQVSYGNSSEYHHSTRLYHQRSTKSVVPMYKMLRHGLVSELMVEFPGYIEPRTQYRIDIANEAKHLEMAGTNSDSYGDVKQSERKLSRRDLQSEASNIFRRYYKRPQKRTGTSTVPTATRPADGYFLKVVQSVNLTTSDIATITQSSIESSSSISTSGPDAQATQTLVSTSVEDSATTPSSTIASETTETTALSTVTEQATASSIDQTTISTETSDVATTSTTDSATETPLSQLQYWGGTMMVDPVNVYHIYYGNWSTNQRQVIDDFITNFPTSSYWKTILPTYKDNKGRTASTSATLKSSIVEDYSHGLVLDDQSVEDVISDMILSGQLGDPDPNGVYMLMTDKDVQQTSGFCETYCGYHDFFEVQGVQIKYGYMGDPANCIAGCSPANPVNSPNNDPGLDSVVSILLHELIEIITDPVPPTGWIDGFGNENGDLCAYSYGGVQRLSSGAFFNQVVGGRRYLVQLMWAMDVNGCRS